MGYFKTEEHPEDGMPGHWESRHYPEDKIPASGHTAYDVWIPHCPFHREELLPCHICEAAGIGDDEGWE